MKKFLFDLFPLILFFIAYRYADIYVATGAAMAAGVAQILWLKLRRQPIETMHWINLGVIVFFGGATLLLHDEAFIKWKPTVLYWVFGAVLLGARLFTGRNLLRKLLGAKIQMPDAIWDRFNASWAVFFLAAGVLNLFVAFSGYFSEAQWVNFKVFGLTVLLLAFVVIQSLWLGRHMQSPGESTETERRP
ncbi:septation protein A [Orrella sp. JC864]|uniref:septation protein A n=1 Tax=Orrella sp. JC864 TaxID=3120298 RepID=UPI0012BC817E